MIIVTNVDYLEVPDDRDYIMSRYRDNFSMPIAFDKMNPLDINTYTEAITGIKFQRPDGTQIRIGFANDPHDILFTPLHSFESLHKTNQEQRLTICKYKAQVEADMRQWAELVDKYMEVNVLIDCSSFWARLKYLFTRTLK